jgi:hypothetical protein
MRIDNDWEKDYEKDHTIATDIKKIYKNRRNVAHISICLTNDEMNEVVSADGLPLVVRINKNCHCYTLQESLPPPLRIVLEPRVINGFTQAILISDCVVAIMCSRYELCSHYFLEGFSKPDANRECIAHLGS